MIEGENVTLRALRPDDVDVLNQWRNCLSNKIMTQGFRFPTSQAKDNEWVNLKMLTPNNNEVYFIVEVEQSAIGLIQLSNIDYISGTATWGFIIGNKNHRGKGYSVEAALLLLNYSFNVLNLRKIISYNLVFNIATLKMHKKIGAVKEEGCLKEHYYFNNKYWDVIILAFYKNDFSNLSLTI